MSGRPATTAETAVSYFSTPAVDHAVAGVVAGTVSTLCMNPLDLLKTRFQVNQSAFSAVPTERSPSYQAIARRRWLYWGMGGRQIVDIADGIYGIYKNYGWGGLYRGVVPNVVGNASSWGLYFLWYTMFKEAMAPQKEGAEPTRLSPGGHLLAATESGVITAIMTNPLWVVKTRMFTTTMAELPLRPGVNGSVAGDPARAGLAQYLREPGAERPVAYRGLIHGLVHTLRTEGIMGLYKGVGLAILGVSNGAIQFMAYEQLKQWRSISQLRRSDATRKNAYSEQELDNVKLSNTEYTILSGVAKLVAITLTYPYQVVRSRVQSHATAHLYPNVWTCVKRTAQEEGFHAFYRGFATNAVRILPGTCVTFVAYENVAWMLRTAALARTPAVTTSA